MAAQRRGGKEGVDLVLARSRHQGHEAQLVVLGADRLDLDCVFGVGWWAFDREEVVGVGFVVAVGSYGCTGDDLDVGFHALAHVDPGLQGKLQIRRGEKLGVAPEQTVPCVLVWSLRSKTQEDRGGKMWLTKAHTWSPRRPGCC